MHSGICLLNDRIMKGEKVIKRFYETEDFEVFSLRIAKGLEQKGFTMKGSRPDKKGTGRSVFIFQNTPEIRQAFNDCLI